MREPWNGLAFSPDEKKLYVVEWKGTPNRSIWSYDISENGKASNKTKVVDAADQGALDGFRVDRDGNLWCAATAALACRMMNQPMLAAARCLH